MSSVILVSEERAHPESDSGLTTFARMTEPNFKDRVIEIVLKIPYGRVTTYGTIATLAGIPRGARLVGGLLHASPDLSWYRVINRHGFISIKCLDHPKVLQKALLQQEGIEVSSDFMVNLEKYGWFGTDKPARLVKKHRSTSITKSSS